ncbi:MAG: hypothetical protein ACXVJ7_04775 [Acidimicrobiia bacterium]
MLDRATRPRRHGRITATGLALAAGLGLLVAPAAPASAAAGTSPVRSPLQVVEDCIAGHRPVTTLTGPQSGRFTSDVGRDATVDALGATWLQTDNWPISFGGGPGGCWLGGRVIGTYPQSTPWSSFHHTGAMNLTKPDFDIVGLRVHNIGDGIRIRAGASDFRVSGVHMSFLHDDCVENDQLYSGVIEDSLFDGCYVPFSARPSSGDSVEGRRNTETIRDNVVRLQPTPTVYKGRAPGTGGFFKWDESGRAPKLVVEGNVFRADQRPNHQDLGLPKGYDVQCHDNVVVWLGKGRYPDRLPKCFRVTTDRRVWDRAVAGWYAAHPWNP